MRELTVRIRFTIASLGNVKSYRTVRKDGKKKRRPVFLFPRDHEGRVILMQSWWAHIMRKAADVMCRHQQHVREIRFSLAVDGLPGSVADNEIFRRYYGAENNFSPHEAFFAGDVIGVSCLVPAMISDDDFWRLMSLAGEYYGMSAFRPGEYGNFKVEGIERRGPQPESLETKMIPIKP